MMPSPHALLTGLLGLLSIPLVTGLVGWFTNWLAIEMMFRPLRRRGLEPLAWQGVIPARCEKMAKMCVDTMTDKLVSPAELIGRIDTNEITQRLSPELQRRAERVLSDVLARHYPKLWTALPMAARKKVTERMRAEIPALVAAITEELRQDADELLDIEHIIVSSFTSNVPLLNELFRRCGGAEFAFIAHCGLGFGTLFGCAQLAVWLFVQPLWFLPVTGLLVGWATNWLALKMVFEPLHPVDVLGVRWQGLFLKRQPEVAEAYAAFFASQVLRADVMLAALLRGAASERLVQLVQRHVGEAIDEVAGPSRSVVQLVEGTSAYLRLKRDLRDRLIAEVPTSIKTVHAYADEALDIESTLRERLAALPSADFERVLHPVFEEDEWILIAVGAALGLVAGTIQLLIVSL